jgi:hypothetical protein
LFAFSRHTKSHWRNNFDLVLSLRKHFCDSSTAFGRPRHCWFVWEGHAEHNPHRSAAFRLCKWKAEAWLMPLNHGNTGAEAAFYFFSSTYYITQDNAARHPVVARTAISLGWPEAVRSVARSLLGRSWNYSLSFFHVR